MIDYQPEPLTTDQIEARSWYTTFVIDHSRFTDRVMSQRFVKRRNKQTNTLFTGEERKSSAK